ncbi:Fungal-trans domain-containing protein [Mycena indigotica]|uniref:Fungal-trans domain-containing protein n=1 Tax=Mycena indigotica TaxID=2126181 RepID=A0A8H6SHP5_9AGAR|nr:Fungal-trans domain-containing protein [Mycena indigotica]KAF7299153.1 Fungal-trans domain-containing protein [Mycena indigotica]
MSDDEDQHYYASSQHSSPPVKQKKVDRSCDLCRKRKSECDGPKTEGVPNASCAHCVSFGSPCTYLLPTKKRGPKNKQVEELKRQVAVLESKLRTLSICSLCSQPLRNDGSVFQHGTPSSDSTASDDVKEEADDEEAEELASELNRIAVDSKFFGANSGFALANEAIAAKERVTGQVSPDTARRLLFWQVLPWEKEVYEQQIQFVYPEPNLLYDLLQLYFAYVHPTLPILHRPSFERSVSEGLHHKDPQFGAMLLAVLAVASRFSDDPRVFVDGQSTLSSGWRFIAQIPVVRKFFEPNIYEVIFYFLMSLYSIGTSRPQASWIYLGNGIRFLQQRGEHRRKREAETDKDKEIWCRAFWSFVLLDRMICAYIGRPAGLHVEDYDADPMLQVDDEYWDTGFKQPPDRPAYSAFFICYVQLSEILGDAMRQLYGSKKSKTLQGWNGKDWEARAVSNLDSRMNSIFDSLPPHLRWDPDRKPRDAFFDQSFVLYVTYYYTQIVVHRPYIQKMSAVAAPSLSICARAARSILHATDAWFKIQRRLPMQFCVSPVFVSSVILIMNTFGKRPGPSVDKDKALVAKAMELIKFAEARLHPQGRLWELLNRLQSVDGPLSKQRVNIAGAAPSPSYKVPPRPSPSHSPPYIHAHANYGEMAQHIPAAPLATVSSEMYPSPLASEGQPSQAAKVSRPTPPPPPPPPQRWHESANPSLNAGSHLSYPLADSPPNPSMVDFHQSYSYHHLQPGMSIEELLAQTAQMDNVVAPVGNPYIQQMHAVYVQEDDMAIEEADFHMWQSIPDNVADVAQWGMYMQRNSSASPPSFVRSY